MQSDVATTQERNVQITIGQLLNGESVAGAIRKMSSDYVTTVRKRKEARSARSREAFIRTMTHWLDVCSVLGNPGALDYAHCTAGQGVQNPVNPGLPLIDYKVDVLMAAESSCTPDELEIWNDVACLRRDLEPTVVTTQYYALQEKLGAVFISREIYPAAKYFGGIRD